jgi:hypothetical protein
MPNELYFIVEYFVAKAEKHHEKMKALLLGFPILMVAPSDCFLITLNAHADIRGDAATLFPGLSLDSKYALMATAIDALGLHSAATNVINNDLQVFAGTTNE